MTGYLVGNQFQPGQKENHHIARNLNAAFLIVLSGKKHIHYEQAYDYLRAFEKDQKWKKTAALFREGVNRVTREIEQVRCSDDNFKKVLDKAAAWCLQPHTSGSRSARQKIWRVFFPEGAWCLGDHEDRIAKIRARRRIYITKPNPHPIQKPSREILFNSNILITVPQNPSEINTLPYSPDLRNRLQQISQEDQLWWYDHPIRIGVEAKYNEVVHGLEGLNRAMAFEKQRGTMKQDETVTCLFSVSVTHQGLQEIAKDYLREVFAQINPLRHLSVYVFTELDSKQMLNDIIIPASEKYLGISQNSLMKKIYGVDGEYGRHYSFLKAIAAFWKVLIDPWVKGTFKFDMDQVFAQDRLVQETGLSALEHFLTPLWGAKGTDMDGSDVEMGMMAGALVNESDIDQGLFTPDVPIPKTIEGSEALVFFSPLPMALSTQAEMMTRYEDKAMDGIKTCLQRVHVTGGTTAVLINSLFRHRPFTPTSIGRAEDQAYLLSCLFSNSNKGLRYLHKPGLIMRHDNQPTPGYGIGTDRLGKHIGDLARTLLFSYYASALPWSWKQIKDTLDPFTGCFITRLPFSVVYLRLALSLADLFSLNNPASDQEGATLLKLGVNRLDAMIRDLAQEPNPVIEWYTEEQKGWHIFYDVLDRIEKELAAKDEFAIELKRRAEKLISECSIQMGAGNS